MDPQNAATALQSLIAFTGILLIWNVFWPRHRVDAARQQYFTIRDRLFLVALRAQGGVQFDSASYRRRRRQINSMINSMGHLNVWGVLSVFIRGLITKDFFKSSDELQAKREDLGISPEGRAALELIDRDMMKATIKFMVLRSPLSCAFVFGVFTSYVFASLAIRYIKRAVERQTFHLALNPFFVIRARIDQRIAQEVRTVVQHADEFDEVAPWRHVRCSTLSISKRNSRQRSLLVR